MRAKTRIAWPRDDQASLRAYYGTHEIGSDGRPTAAWEAEHLASIELPYAMRLDWDRDRVVHRITCHRLIAAHLSAALRELLDSYGLAAIRAGGLDLYGGCYNYRPRRSASSLSVHAWAAAIDLAPGRNPMGAPWNPKTGIPRFAVAVFAKHGARWGGEWRRPDPMHFEWTS